LSAALASLALAVGVVTGPAVPASADPVNPLTASVDKAVAHPGETVTLTVTFTNPEAVPVTFSYLSATPVYATQVSGVDYAMTSCTGQINSCWYSTPEPWAAYMNPTSPIAPGATRTVDITFQVEPTSACGGGRNITFFFYTYRESTAGFVGQIVNGPPGTEVVC
jgi:hypothetical protein